MMSMIQTPHDEGSEIYNLPMYNFGTSFYPLDPDIEMQMQANRSDLMNFTIYLLNSFLLNLACKPACCFIHNMSLFLFNN